MFNIYVYIHMCVYVIMMLRSNFYVYGYVSHDGDKYNEYLIDSLKKFIKSASPCIFLRWICANSLYMFTYHMQYET